MNNTNNNLSIPEDISGSDFSKWTFYTKDEYEEILSSKKDIDIFLLYELIINGLEFKKFDNEKMDQVLLNFEKQLKKEELFDRIIKIGSYDWYIICGELFEDYELAYSKIQNIFDFTEDEKEEFEILKQKKFFISYQSKLQEIIKSFEEDNFTKIKEYTYNDTNGKEKNGDFINKIQEILILLNYKNSYSISFVDISGKQIQFNISNNTEKLLGYNYGLLEKETFHEHILEAYGEFILNLDKNNMDFSILIFKENGDKDDIPDEEDYLIAA